MEEEYSFDLQEIEKKPYRIGGYAEFRPAVSWLDKDAALYALRFYDRDEGDSIEEYNLTLQLDGSYEKGMARLTIKTDSDLKKTYLGWEDRIAIFEGYLSLKPFPSLNIDIGKKTLKWGKGYIWTPSAFLDRTKNPNDPDLALEGYVVASADYIKSFDGPLKTLSFTPVLIPVYDHLNDDFGKTGSVNFASRLYLLLYDTDIDCTFMTGGSKTLR